MRCSASAPSFFQPLASEESAAAPAALDWQLPLPTTLHAWASRCLADDTAPLLAAIVLAQACDDPDLAAREEWRSLHDIVIDSEFDINLPDVDSFEERERSRAADAALGEGPVMVDFSPPDPQASGGIAAASSWMVAEQAPDPCTFGSSRDASTFGVMNPSLQPLPASLRPGMARKLRFQNPGPGAYSPQIGSVPYASASHTSAFPSGATFGRDDRLKHLTRTVRPRGQYTALPLMCGPSPGFYSNPIFPAPKERAAAGSRCRARFFPPAAELPGGQPPERNRERVQAARDLNRKGLIGPDPCSYTPAIDFQSDHQTKLAGRWAASKPAASPRASAASFGEGEGGEADYEIERQAEDLRQQARDRRLDQRRREVVEDELNRVKQKHQLLAAGAKRSIGGRKGASSDGSDVLATLRERLDGSLQRMSDLFRAIDTSWDGRVDREELGMALAGLGLSVTRDELRGLFDIIDVDKSGEIDFKELKRALTYRPPSAVATPKANASHRRWEHAKSVASLSESQLLEFQAAGHRRRTGGEAHTSPWAIGSGRDLSTLLLNGIEPPERRSLGPATYDPRGGVAAVKPRMGSLGGDLTKGKRAPLQAEPGSTAGYIYRGMANLEGPWNKSN